MSMTASTCCIEDCLRVGYDLPLLTQGGNKILSLLSINPTLRHFIEVRQRTFQNAVYYVSHQVISNTIPPHTRCLDFYTVCYFDMYIEVLDEVDYLP